MLEVLEASSIALIIIIDDLNKSSETKFLSLKNNAKSSNFSDSIDIELCMSKFSSIPKNAFPLIGILVVFNLKSSISIPPSLESHLWKLWKFIFLWLISFPLINKFLIEFVLINVG